ncbi:hypothetical protein [Brucella anthropi]|uniref:hypothetical protein n=1 Tax=Brucella anthropi TaxID=529 RepID=UPI0039864ECE
MFEARWFLLFGESLDGLGNFVSRRFATVEAARFNDFAAFRQRLVDAEESFEVLRRAGAFSWDSLHGLG